MGTLLHASDTRELDTKQHALLSDLDGEVCVREMLGTLSLMMKEAGNVSLKKKDFVSRAPQVLLFLRDHGIDFFADIDFSGWDNGQWTKALKFLQQKQRDIDTGLISSANPDLALVGAPFVKEGMARRAGASPHLLAVLEEEIPEFDFDDFTLDRRSVSAKVGDLLRLTFHPRFSSDHSIHTRFVRDTLIPKVKEVVAHSVAAEGNHMARRWLDIRGSHSSPSTTGIHREVFFRQLEGMRVDRAALFETVEFANEHVANERVMNPKARAGDVTEVLTHIKTSLQAAWSHKHQAGKDGAAF